MDIVTLGAALNGSAEYVNSHFKGGSNIQIVDNPDGTQTINASGEVSAEDTVARADIAAIKDGETLDSFGDVETALATKANTATTYTKTEVDNALSAKANSADVYSKTAVDTALGNKADKSTTYTKTEVDTALSAKADATDIPTVPITAIQKNGTGITPVSGTVNITVPTQASDVNAATATQGDKADTAIQGIKVNSSTVNPDSNRVVSITVPTTAADVSALPDTTKYAAALSLTINSSTFVMTGQLKDQNGDNLGTAQTIDLPLESVVVGGSYNSQTKKVVLTLQNGNTIEFSVADLVSGLQTELSASNKLNPAYINYDSTHRAVSDTEKSIWNRKQSALSSSQLAAVNSGIDSEKVEQIETNKNNISTVANQSTRYNLSSFSGAVATSDNIPIATGVLITIPTGDYYATYDATVSTGVVTLGLKDNNDNIVTTVSVSNNTKLQSFTVPNNDVRYFNVFTSKAGTYSNFRIIPKAVYDAGFVNYQPYAMSNAELTAAIQALQAQLANQ